METIRANFEQTKTLVEATTIIKIGAHKETWVGFMDCPRNSNVERIINQGAHVVKNDNGTATVITSITNLTNQELVDLGLAVVQTQMSLNVAVIKAIAIMTEIGAKVKGKKVRENLYIVRLGRANFYIVGDKPTIKNNVEIISKI